jgi:phage terminase Nu1 subunit (DNA packaging protein)
MDPHEIAALVARFPLPDGVPDAVLNKRELSDFFGISLPTLDAWIADGLPSRVEGTNGRQYEFQASTAWAWKCARDEGDRIKSTEAQAAIAAMRLALIGGKSGNSIQSLPPKERQQLYDVEAAYERLKRERYQSLDREEVNQVLNDLLRMIRDGISALPDTLERVANLDGKGVTASMEACDELLDELERVITRFFADRPIVTREERTDLFN